MRQGSRVPIIVSVLILTAAAGLPVSHAFAAPVCPSGTWQYSLRNLDDSAQPGGEDPLVVAGSRIRIETRCKFGRPGVRYPLNVCARYPGAVVRCHRTAVAGMRFGGPVVVATAPGRRRRYRVSWTTRPGAPVFMRASFRTYAGEETRPPRPRSPAAAWPSGRA